MIEILPNLFIGTAFDYENDVKDVDGWAVVHAAKEPYHRQLLGYTGRAAAKDHPEYLMAKRGDRLFLNLIDAPMVDFIPKEVIEAALNFISEKISEGKKVLVHCNLGESRAPTIGMLYMVKAGSFGKDFPTVVKEFKKIYPKYDPGVGMADFAALYLSGKI